MSLSPDRFPFGHSRNHVLGVKQCSFAMMKTIIRSFRVLTLSSIPLFFLLKGGSDLHFKAGKGHFPGVSGFELST